MNIIGLIPLSGNATRMKHLPKFLLPCKPGLTLLDNTIVTFKKINILDIYAGVSDSNYNLLTQYDINKKIINSLTMAETVKKLIESYYAKKYILIMPDTFFHIDERFNKIEKMLDDYKIVICIWKIKDYQVGKLGQVKLVNNEVVDIIDKDNTCKYEYAWGVIAWCSELNDLIDPTWNHIGYLINKSIELKIPIGTIIMPGTYYDCGTYEEYFTFIKQEN